MPSARGVACASWVAKYTHLWEVGQDCCGGFVVVLQGDGSGVAKMDASGRCICGGSLPSALSPPIMAMDGASGCAVWRGLVA